MPARAVLEPSRQRIVRQLRLHGALSRTDLAARSGLSRATVTSALADLLDEGLVELQQQASPAARSAAVGRPPALVTLARRAGAAAGIDFGKSHVRVGVSDLAHVMLAERVSEVPADLPSSDAVTLAESLLDDALAEAGLDRRALAGVGVAVPGPLHVSTGRLGSATILPGWAGVDAEQLLADRFQVPVRLDNDANLGALAERTWGAGQGCDDFAYLKLATGVGCGLVFGGQVYRGAGGTAGELGHVVVEPGGVVCRCGNRGCLETVTGTEPVLALLRPTLGALTISDVVARARAGDMTCGRVIADTGSVVGGALATLVNLFNPRRIIVGGVLAGAGDLLLDPLRAAVARAAVQSAVIDLEVLPATLDERAELAGAIALVLHDPTLTLPT